MKLRRNAAAVLSLGMVLCLFAAQAQPAKNDIQPAAVKAMDDLPCKLVMVDTADRGLPGYRAELKWNTGRTPEDAEFLFTPAPGATEVPLSQMAQSDEAGKP